MLTSTVPHVPSIILCFVYDDCMQVFSDEFEQDGRSFEDGSDPRWTAIDKNDCELCDFTWTHYIIIM